MLSKTVQNPVIKIPFMKEWSRRFCSGVSSKLSTLYYILHCRMYKIPSVSFCPKQFLGQKQTYLCYMVATYIAMYIVCIVIILENLSI